MNTTKVRILDYLGQTWWIHLWTVVMLTPWLIMFIGYTEEQYITWSWQAPIIALGFNFSISWLIRWFVPKWRKRIGYKEPLTREQKIVERLEKEHNKFKIQYERLGGKEWKGTKPRVFEIFEDILEGNKNE